MEENLTNFALTEEEFNKLKDANMKSLEELENFDFISGGEINVDDYHDMVEALKISKDQTDEKKEALKQLEAENIVKEFSVKFLGEEFTTKYNHQKDNLWAFLRKYDATGDLVKGMGEQDKDKIYDIAEYLFNDYQMNLNHLNFIFPLSYEEHKFLYDVMTKKLEYNQDEVFQMEDLKENYLDFYKTFKKEGVSENNLNTIININHLVILYHLFSKYKVKGVQSDFENFKGILRKIGERTKLYNAYNVMVQRLSSQFQVWGGSLTEDESALNGQVLPPNTEPVIIDEKTGEVK